MSRTTSIVKLKYVFRKMRRKVRAYVRSCDVSQRGKADTHLPRNKMGHLEMLVRKWESVSVGFISLPEVSLPATSVTVDEILTVTDRATNMVVLLPCNSRWNAAEVADNFWWEVVRYHGFPRSIISDRRPVFLSQFQTELIKFLDIDARRSSSYHPPANGQRGRTRR